MSVDDKLHDNEDDGSVMIVIGSRTIWCTHRLMFFIYILTY